jgi:AraC family transcriptional regulator, arabinose operon regulatory protein
MVVTQSPQKDFRIQKVVQTLDQNPFRTVLQLAQNCQISTSRLSHLFKDEIGINVKNYLLDCRLQVAAEMLESSGMPIKEIAYTVGYRHSSSFVRAFKTHFGLSPVCYRRGQRGQAAAAASANK